jgi:Papain-like cysteine protease AvrRpt2
MSNSGWAARRGGLAQTCQTSWLALRVLERFADAFGPAIVRPSWSAGPLWVAAAVPGPHIRVVTGVEGDGTTRYINDPWEAGMQSFRLPNAGARYTESYAEFVKKQETLARQEMSVPGVYVAHARVVRR